MAARRASSGRASPRGSPGRRGSQGTARLSASGPSSPRASPRASPRGSPSSHMAGGGMGKLLAQLDGCLRDPDVDRLRNLTARIARLVRQDKAREEVLMKKNRGVPILLATLEAAHDGMVLEQVSGVFADLAGVCPKKLARREVGSALAKILASLSKSSGNHEAVYTNLFTALAELGGADKRFALSFRLTGCLVFTLAHVKARARTPKALLPPLRVLVAASGNPTSVAILGRQSGVSVAHLLLSANNQLRTHEPLRLALQFLTALLANRHNCETCAQKGGLKLILDVLLDWHAKDTRNKYLGIRQQALNAVKSLVQTDAGRRAFLAGDGVNSIFNFVQNIAEGSEPESLISTCLVILRKCQPTVKLPSAASPLCFALPPRSTGPGAEGEARGGQAVSQAALDAETDATQLPSPGLDAVFEADLAAHVCVDCLRTADAAPLFPELREGFTHMADPSPPDNQVSSVRKFATRAPTAVDHLTSTSARRAAPEPLLQSTAKLKRSLLYQDIQLLIKDAGVNKPVFDADHPAVYDKLPASRKRKCLRFQSDFESGNLRQATQMYDRVYDLVLSPDTNTNGFLQWFFFSVSNMEAGVAYKFNLVNQEKTNSQFNFGMQPLLFSTVAGTGWRRAGSNVLYFKNSLPRLTAKGDASTFFTTTFSIVFEHPEDTVFLAYHYPYTYSDLQLHLHEVSVLGEPFLTRQLLCHTLGGNRCELLTVTSLARDDLAKHPLAARQYIVISARVHPGESNSSWVMKGLLDFLVSSSPDARELRRRFIFKIVPMLNPDGVVNGHLRCSLAGCDLNRQWLDTDPRLHPTVFNLKLLLYHLQQIGRSPLLFCDFHGHSRKKMIFMYGCTSPDEPVPREQTFPRLLAEHSPLFSMKNCRFAVEKSKESTARVAAWRHLGVKRSYTLESTYCGADKGPLKGLQINTGHLQDMGREFAETLLRLIDPACVDRIEQRLADPGPAQSSEDGGLDDDGDDGDGEQEASKPPPGGGRKKTGKGRRKRHLGASLKVPTTERAESSDLGSGADSDYPQ